MFIFGLILFIFGYLLAHMFYDDLQNIKASDNGTSVGNVSLENLISDSAVKTWIAESLESSSKHDSTIKDCERFEEKNFPIENNFSKIKRAFHGKCFVDSLFQPPLEVVDADWTVILGSYSHYAHKNWKEFLIATNCPFFVRLLIDNMSETITVSRKFKKRKKASSRGTKSTSDKNDSKSSSDFIVSVKTNLWVFSYNSKFRLGEMFVEHDIDGTDSENVFFFTAPRLLVHNKMKTNANITILYNFNETGVNTTLISRENFVVARRFFKRIL